MKKQPGPLGGGTPRKIKEQPFGGTPAKPQNLGDDPKAAENSVDKNDEKDK